MPNVFNVDYWTNQLDKLLEQHGSEIAAFIAGKNSRQLATWLKSGIDALSSGEGLFKKWIGKSALKGFGLYIAITKATNQIKRTKDEVSTILSKDDINGLEKLARVALEMWPPVAEMRDLKAFWNWLTKKPTQNKIAQNSPEAQEMKRQSKLALIGASDEQLAEKNRAARAATDQAAKDLGFVERPTNLTAQTEWAKEVEKQMKNKNFKKTKGSNDPAFYLRGNAKTLNAGTLTWTTVKSNDREGRQAFATAVLINATLNIPTIKSSSSNTIHPRIKEQIALMVQGLRGKNTGAYQYNEEDVYNYVIEMASLIARYKQVKRNLSILNKSNPFVNREGEVMFNACYNSGGAYAAAIPDRPNYISRMNAIANVINSFAVPNISLISKWNYNAEKVFIDYNGKKPVAGIFKAYHYPYVVAATGKVGVGTNNYTTINAEIIALESEVASLINVISNLNAQAGVFTKISADFIKLLGASKATFDNVPFCSITDLVEMKYDKACIEQLRNAMIVGNQTAVVSFASYDGTTPFSMNNLTKISSGSLPLSATDVFPGSYDSSNAFHPWLMTYDDEAKERSAGENIEMIQYTYTYSIAFSSGSVAKTLLDTPAAIIENMVVWYFEPGSSNLNSYLLLGFHTLNDTGADGYYAVFETQANRQIDFLPSAIITYNGSTSVRVVGVENDVDNYTYMNDNQFYNMNNVATYSLFYLYTPEELNIKGIIDVY